MDQVCSIHLDQVHLKVHPSKGPSSPASCITPWCTRCLREYKSNEGVKTVIGLMIFNAPLLFSRVRILKTAAACALRAVWVLPCRNPLKCSNPSMVALKEAGARGWQTHETIPEFSVPVSASLKLSDMPVHTHPDCLCTPSLKITLIA